MTRSAIGGAWQRIHRFAAAQARRDLGDAELLDRFASARDEAAFAVLVERYGPLVLGACRRALGNHHDAEDACQATFLVLARHAASVRRGAAVGGWLHGVACRVAANLRRARGRRQRHEGRQTPPTAPDPAAEAGWREALAVLDDELRRLPEPYRSPLLLCYLDGRPRAEVARRLALSPGALHGRLERARRLLGDRLARRGLTLSAALLTTAVGQARPGPAFALATARAAGLFAHGEAPGADVVSRKVLTLAREALAAVNPIRRFVTAAALAAGLLLAAVAPVLTQAPAAPDEFQATHKYQMPLAAKAAEAVQRREYTYSVRALIRVMPPYNLKALNDDYQDVRVRSETKDYAELEVTVYPLNTNAQDVQGNPNWKRAYAGMTEYLAPGITTNWDEAMRRDLLAELKGAGIDPERLTDKEVVERVSAWLFRRNRYRYQFCTFYADFRDGRPRILPGLEQAFGREKGDPAWGAEEQFAHELLGKEMFANRSVGTCTSAAILQTTVLRALGIPTRMVLCIPVADGTDPAQVALAERGLTHHRVRRDTLLGLAGCAGFTSHTFCEVFVGGRWRRLNYQTLGQNVLDPQYLGLMIHVHTFNDLSEANLAATWGARYGRGQRDETFPHGNPYRLLEIADHFGKHAAVPNPPVAELTRVTIGKAYWRDGKEVSATLRGMMGDPRPDGAGHLLIHGEEWLEDAGNYLQYKVFLQRADPAFVLKAPGQPDVRAHLEGAYYTAPSEGLREMAVLIPAAEFAKMARGVAYALHPVNGKPGPAWQVRPDLTVTRE